MSVDSETVGAQVDNPPTATAPPTANPALMGLICFLPSGITLGLWFVGYLHTAALPGGMIPILTFSAGLFLFLATAASLRAGDSVTAAIFGVFSAFWISFGVLLMALNNGWIVDAGTGGPLSTDQIGSIQSTYLLSFTLAFILLTLATLRLPLMFTVGFVLVDVTFVLAYLAVTAGNAALFPIAGITTFGFCLVFAYIMFDAFGQTLGGRPMAMGGPLVKS
ncbi:GPR1/FUN34/YaaH family transporter [Pseudonocardia parietis]|uniref:Succinate-acetate transporter protein n=1 Tax=Pseudonocardia parietis TaxID=570936 RepID=A0ABS4VPQ8_9PSEU|nr:GPR1/FUN34/YaaH family transporter [Pseudonocardia parietis]MBP2365914.1 succinate-acetate transporter protein [Pseudonocardia parietis]